VPETERSVAMAGSASVVLGPADLETLLIHVAVYHREGLAPVAHVAVALGGRPDSTLVVRARDVVPSGPGEEAIRLLEGP
jgi:hypothetical protein